MRDAKARWTDSVVERAREGRAGRLRFRGLARLFDRLEVVRPRGLGRRPKERWRGSSAAAKALVVLAATACVAALGYALFTWGDPRSAIGSLADGKTTTRDGRPAR